MFKEITHLDTVESTHVVLQQMASAGDEACGKVVAADYQTGGKGQGANQWHSKAGLNILMSYCWCPANFSASRQFDISMAVSMALVHLMDEYKIPAISVKWPNDVWSGQRKLAGVLVSNNVTGSNIQHSIISIGLNVNQCSFPFDLPNPVSMFNLTGMAYSRQVLMHRFIQLLSEMLCKLEARDSESLRTAYLSRLLGLGRKCLFNLKGKLVECEIAGVDEYGRIQLIQPDGLTMGFELSEARLVQ